MTVAKGNLPGSLYQKQLTASGLSGKTVSNVEIYRVGVATVIAVTPSAGNPCYFILNGNQVMINSSGSGNDEWTSTGGVLVTPQGA